MTSVIAKHEWRLWFRSPAAWLIIGLSQFLIAYQFLAQIELYAELQPRLQHLEQPPGVTRMVIMPTFATATMLILFLVPIVSMHTLSGERRNGILRLLYAAPVPPHAIVLGKYLGLFALIVLLILMTTVMCITLHWGGPIDFGTLVGCVIAATLMSAAALAVGLCYSAWCQQPVVAATLTLVSLLTLWLLDWGRAFGEDTGILRYLSSLNHFELLARGLISVNDVGYFTSIILVSLGLAMWRLHADQHAL